MDEENSPDATPEVKLKKEKILLKFVLWSVGGIIALCIGLLALGYIMHVNGTKPPTLDWDVVENQIDKVLGKEDSVVPDELLPKEW